MEHFNAGIATTKAQLNGAGIGATIKIEEEEEEQQQRQSIVTASLTKITTTATTLTPTINNSNINNNDIINKQKQQKQHDFVQKDEPKMHQQQQGQHQIDCDREQQQQQQQRERQRQPSHEMEHQEQEQGQQQEQLYDEQQQQQFCLRWHNHQTSLLSTLPILLDQCQLTDVTISAEGRTLRAHRVVLSACSTFFLEIFRSLDANNHPVIIIPGASFTAIVALLTFMYSGEVNVYEEQIPVLLNLAETLGIKGLTDVHNNNDIKMGCNSLWQKTGIMSDSHEMSNVERSSPLCNKIRRIVTPKTPTQLSTQLQSQSLSPTQLHLPSQSDQMQQQSLVDTTTSTLFQSLLNHKLASLSSAAPTTTSSPSTASPVASTSTIMATPLENFLMKSLQFYPNFLQQPLNFTQMALDKYQQQQYTTPNSRSKVLNADEPDNEDDDDCTLSSLNKRFCLDDNRQQQKPEQEKLKEPKEEIIEIRKETTNQSLTMAEDTTNSIAVSASLNRLHNNHGNVAKNSANTIECSQKLAPLTYAPNIQNRMPNTAFKSPIPFSGNTLISNEMGFRMDNARKNDNSLLNQSAASGSQSITPTNVTNTKTCPNSKLYATCFICHKQLSNQYNLRVHLETHQNVRYACNVCPHVSRSKDALRKHVSYRHPGVPSPCETDTRRKRSNKILTNIKTTPILPSSSSSSTDNIPSSSPLTMSTQSTVHFPIPTPVTTKAEALNAVNLKSPGFMFLPTQFHIVAAAAAAADQHKVNPFLINSKNANTYEHLTNKFGSISQPTTTSLLTKTNCSEVTTNCSPNNNNNNNSNNNISNNNNNNNKNSKNNDSIGNSVDEIKLK